MMQSQNDVWIIRHKKTKEILKVPSGKTSWKKINHAKCAWATFQDYCGWDAELIKTKCTLLGVEPIQKQKGFMKIVFPKFDQQSTYEVVRLPSDYEVKLEQARLLLGLALSSYPKLNDDVYEKIKIFLKED